MDNPWKVTAIGIALVVVTAFVTTVVVANWTGRRAEPPAVGSASPRSDLGPAPPSLAPVPVSPATPVASPAPASAPVAPTPAPAVPSKVAIDACNRYAANPPTTKDKTVEVVKDGAIGGAIGAVVGAAGGAIAGGGSGAGKGAAIGGIVGIGGGALYGLNENRKNDERYREAYARCMRSRGYTG
jgi:type IV secretory pathway VirB10-like protein